MKESVEATPFLIRKLYVLGVNAGVKVEASCPTIVPTASLLTVRRATVKVPGPVSCSAPQETLVSCDLNTPPLAMVGSYSPRMIGFWKFEAATAVSASIAGKSGHKFGCV